MSIQKDEENIIICISFHHFISEKNYSAEAFQCQTILPTLESVVEEVTGAFSVNAI